MTDDQFDIRWHDGGGEAQQPSNPAYPEGIDLPRLPGLLSCQTKLPYPAARCGLYMIECKRCGMKIGVTTAGRPDDPRSVWVPCKDQPDTAGTAQ